MKITYTLDDQEEDCQKIKRMASVEDLYSQCWDIDADIRDLLKYHDVYCGCEVCFPERTPYDTNSETVKSLCAKNQKLIKLLDTIRENLGPFMENWT